MKFLILTNNDSDGVGQTAINLSNNLKKLNHEAKVSLLHSKTNDQNIKIIERSIFLRIIGFLFNLLKIKKINNFKKNFLELFWFGNTTINFYSIKKDIENILQESKKLNAKILTTEKDFIKLSVDDVREINFLKIELKIVKEEKFINFINDKLN